MSSSNSSSAAEIVFDHVTKRYANAPKPAIDDLSLTLPAGDICVLIRKPTSTPRIIAVAIRAGR